MDNTWIDNKLLPSLLEKFQNRDKKYSSIIITDRQANFLSSYMKQHYNYNSFHSKCWVSHLEYGWKDRTVYLRKQGNYYMLSFSPNKEEQEAFARTIRQAEHKKNLAMAKRAVEKNNRRLLETMKDRASQSIVYFATMVKEEPEDEYYAKKLAMAKEIYTILKNKMENDHEE